MRVEIRSNGVLIDGYVNAVERESRLIPSPRGSFIEKVQAGAFKRALSKVKSIRALLNHDENRYLASTKDGGLRLFEDNIGLRAILETNDKEVVEKAKNNELRGWSFDFIIEENGDKWEEKDGRQIRTLTDFTMSEVSLIDNTMIPCYSATSVEVRGNNEEIQRETRATECEIVTETFEEETKIDYSNYENKINELWRK